MRWFVSQAFVFLKEILEMREGMTAELRHRPCDDRYPPSNHRAKPRPDCGVNRQARVYTPFACDSHRLYQQLVRLKVGNTAAVSLAEAPLVSLSSLDLNDRLFAPDALTAVQMHRTGSDTLRLRSFLSNANHHFGGQL
jgi:hypothetical protein